jgi:hypothetical protein
VANLAIKIGDSPTLSLYEDGDLVDAFNRRRIRLCHADRICHPRINGVKVGGQLGTAYPLLEKYYQRQAQYRWERVSRTEVKRTNLWTLAEVVYGSTPIEDPDRPGRMIHCHVEEHYGFHDRSRKLPLFGTVGAEIEYGGNSKRDGATTELIWDDIEAATPLRRVDHDLWPASVAELKHFLFVATDEFDDAEELKTPLTKLVPVTEENPDGIEIVKKRKHYIDWKADVAASVGNTANEADVLDRTKTVDIRDDETFVLASIQQTKTVK